MRYFLILLILFFIEQNIYSQDIDTSISLLNYPNSKTPINDSLPLKCKVFRIKEIDKAYIIDIDIKDKSKYFRYTIISLKNEKKDFKKIKRGKWYDFVLLSYYPFIIGDPLFAYYEIDGIRVGFKEDFRTERIVTTPNLQGLYYIPHEKRNK